MDLTPGTIIAGRYRLESKVGEGGMGSVWLGEHVVVGVRVAVKTLLAAAACDHEVVARFRREARLLGRIRSDHVARVLDFIEDPTFGLVLVMEFVEGRSLTRVLHDARQLQIEDAVDLAHDIVSAIGDMHRAQIVHRDLKPGNIIMQPLSGGRRRAVIVDFGMSRIVTEADDDDPEMTGITRADMALGTLEYMAPEAILNSRDVTPASDLYAVGAILYRAVAGQHVYGNAREAELARMKLMQDAPPLPTRRQDRIAVGLAAIVARALRRRAAERYQRAEEMLTDLIPLRELVRAAAVEIELAETHITTITAGLLAELEAASNEQVGMEKTVRAAAVGPHPHPAAASAGGAAQAQGGGGPVRPPAASSPAMGAVATPAEGAQAKPARGGISYGVAATAMAVALAGGMVAGSELNRRGLFPFESGEGMTTEIAARPPTVSRSAAPTASAAPAPEIAASDESMEILDPAESAPPSAAVPGMPVAAPVVGAPRPTATATAPSLAAPTATATALPASTTAKPVPTSPGPMAPAPTSAIPAPVPNTPQ